MTYSIRSTGALAVLWIGMLGAVPALGQSTAGAGPTDPAAPVPPTRYVPMQASPIAAPASSPADNWKALNRTVAAYDSMALTMEIPAPAGPAGSGAVAPAVAPATQPPPAPAAPSHHVHEGVK